VKAYERVGRRDPRWDDAARRFLEDSAARWMGFPGPLLGPEELVRRGRELQKLGCDDPLVTWFLGVALDALADRCGIERWEARALLEKALAGVKVTPYPRAMARCIAADLYANREQSWGIASRRASIGEEELRFFKESLSDGSYRPEESAVLLGMIRSGLFRRDPDVVAEAVAQTPRIEEWVRLVFSGARHLSRGWKARGDDYVDKVPPEGWKELEKELRLAKRDLERAHRLHPDRPEPAYRMMSVALGDQAGEDMRDWFDRTLAAQMDYWSAYECQLNSLRPRWGGSYEEMWALGLEALATKRFDTYVPFFLMRVVQEIEQDSREEAKEAGTSRPSRYEDDKTLGRLREMYEGYLAEPSRQWERGRFESLLAATAVLGGRFDLAYAHLRATGFVLDPDATSRFGVRPEELVPRVVGLGGLAAAEARAAQALMDDHRIAEALTAFQRARRLDSSPLAQRFFRRRIATLTLERDLAKGDWVPFMPPDDELSGWTVTMGACVREKDGALACTPCFDGLLVECLARTGPDVEIRGTVEYVSGVGKALDGGVALGELGHDKGKWISFRVKRNWIEGETAYFATDVDNQRGRSPVALSDTNEILVRSWSGRVGAIVNGRVVAEGAEPPEGFTSGPAVRVGFGSFHIDQPHTVRFRNFRIRRLSSRPPPLAGAR
jgi:hypothetical protein